MSHRAPLAPGGGSGAIPGRARAGVRKRLWLPLMVGALGLLSIGVVVVVDRLTVRSMEHDETLAEILQTLHLELLGARIRLAGSGAATASAGLEHGLGRVAGLLQHLEEEAASESPAKHRPVAEMAARASGRLEELRKLSEGDEPDAPGGGIGEVDRRFAGLAGEVTSLERWVEAHRRVHRSQVRMLLALALGVWGLAVAAAVLVVHSHERRRGAAESTLLESQRRLLEAQKMEAVGRLAGGIAHDINNYLATIRAHCDLILGKDMPRERLVAKVGVVVATVLKASSLIERLLTFSRRQPASPEVVNLNEVVAAMETMLRGTVGREIWIETRLEPDLGWVEVDLSQIEQVIANLVVNARDATKGRGTITLETSNRDTAAESWICLAVSDTGAGIPPEIREKIFEPFFTTKESIGASGLGLATVYGIVDQAEGRIEVESEVGRGTVVRVLLPRYRGSAGPVPVRPVPQRWAASGEHLLLVDDNTELRQAVASQLEAQGYRVTAAADAEAALAAARAATAPFDLVITDVRLPESTGPDLVARLRELLPEVDFRTLYMSGYTDRIALRSGPGRGEAFFLKKPFSAEGLARMVRELLDQPR